MRSHWQFAFVVLVVAALLLAFASCSGKGSRIGQDSPAVAPSGEAPDAGFVDNQDEMGGIAPAEGDDLVLPEGAEPIPFAEETEAFEGVLASDFPEDVSRDVSLDRLNAPTNVVAWDGTYNDRCRVTWEHPAGEQPTVYYVYRSTTPSDPNPTYIGGRSYPGRIFDDTTATPGTKYYYKVKSHKAGFNDSFFSNEDRGWRGDRLYAPTNVTASGGRFNDKVYVYWTHPSGETPSVYYVYRSTTQNDPNPAYIGGRSYPGRTFNDLTASPGVKYYYKLRSHKAGFNASYFSNEHRGWRSAKMNPPTNVAASDGTYGDKVRVTWDHPTGETPAVYYIYRSETPDDPNPTYIGGRSYPGTYFDDTTATPGTTYYYKVKSHKNGFNDSYFSNENAGHRASWNIEVVDSTGDEGGYTSIALDSNDRPHISYYDGTNYDLKYAYYNGSTWEIATVDSAGYVGYYTSIALDSNDRPHIGYYDGTNYDLKYAYYNGSTWEIATVDSADDVGWDTSIAVDSNDRPHIGYRDNSNADLKYAYFNGSSWDIATVDSADDVGAYTSIALSSNDRPHISYFDGSNDDLKYAYYNGSSWDIATIDSTDMVGYDTSIALDSLDRPHISYFDNTNDDLKYAYNNGSSWEITTVDSEGHVGNWSSIALGSNDRPHICYEDWEPNYDLKYAYYNGLSWEITTVDSGSYFGAYTSIALSSNDRPHISYRDEGNYDLKHAWFVG